MTQLLMLDIFAKPVYTNWNNLLTAWYRQPPGLISVGIIYKLDCPQYTVYAFYAANHY